MSKSKYINLNLNRATKKRFVENFKKWDETDEEAFIRLMDKAGVKK